MGDTGYIQGCSGRRHTRASWRRGGAALPRQAHAPQARKKEKKKTRVREKNNNAGALLGAPHAPQARHSMKPRRPGASILLKQYYRTDFDEALTTRSYKNFKKIFFFKFWQFCYDDVITVLLVLNWQIDMLIFWFYGVLIAIWL